MNTASEEHSFDMGFKRIIGGAKIQDPRACRLFPGGSLRLNSRDGEGGGWGTLGTSLLIMNDSALHINNFGVGESYSPFPLLDATSPFLTPTALVVFIIIFLVLRWGGVNISRNPLPQISHEFSRRIPPVGDIRYKTGK